MRFKMSQLLIAASALTLLSAGPALAQKTTAPPSETSPAPPAAPPPPSTSAPPAGPAPDAALIAPGKTVVENASNSPDHTTLVSAVKAAGMVEALSAAGPFTVFAPSNAGFGRLPPGTVDALLKPENQGSLSMILNNHVVAGKVSAADLAKKIKDGKGKATLQTLGGDTLTATSDGTTVKVTDTSGNSSDVVKADIASSNGVIHSINGILIPTQKPPAQPATKPAAGPDEKKPETPPSR